MEQPASTAGNTRPFGQPRGIGFGILMFIATLGFYSLYWVFKTQEEMKQRTGEGIGGILLGFVSATSDGSRRRRSRRSPAGQVCGSSRAGS